MPISVGEVEAVLTARDNMSPALQLAAARVQELEAKLGTLGTTSVESLNVLEGRLAVAKERFDQLAAGGDNAGKVVGQSMQQAEGIALRLIERMAILYAIRGTFQFVVGLYEAADALTKTSAAIDVSIGRLQELQYAADETGLKFTSVTSAMDHLTKSMADRKLATEDALEGIGLSFSKIEQLKPQDMFDAIVEAIGKIPDRMARAKAEIALFGTDALDPMIVKYKELIAQARANNAVMDDETVRILATVTQSYKNFWTGVKDMASEGFAWMVKKTGDAIWEFQKFIDANAESGGAPKQVGDIGLPNMAQNPALQGGTSGVNFTAKAVIMDYIDLLKSETTGVQELTQEQVRQLGILKDLNLLTKENAAALTSQGVSLDIDTPKFEKYVKAMKDLAAMDKAAEAYTQAWERAQKTTDDLWTKSIEARNKFDKEMADLSDKNAKEQLARDLKENDERYKAGIISETLFYANKSSLEYQYYQKHLQTMREDEQANLQSLRDKEQAEMNALEERYAQGKIDEQQYQEQRTAIAERYSIMREGIEQTFLSTVHNMRLEELQKEEEEQRASIARQKAAADQAAAQQKKQQAMNTGNSMTYDLSTPEGYNYFLSMNPAAKVDVGYEYFKTHSLQDAVTAGLVDLYYGFKPGFGGSLMPARAGFAEGGMVDITVGEHGPEAMRVPTGTMVASSGSSLPGSGGAIIVNMNGMLLSSDPRAKKAIADAVIDAITPILRLQRKLGAA